MDATDHFAVVAEIDYCYWLLKQMLESERKLTPIDKLVDQASGFSAVKRKQAERLMRRIERLKKKIGVE